MASTPSTVAATLAGLIVALMSTPTTCPAKDKQDYSHEEFAAILAEAAGLAHYEKAVKLTARTGGGDLGVVDHIEPVEDGRWRVWVTVYDYERGSTESIFIKKFPVLVHNLGTGFEAAFLTPAIPAFLFERSMQNKYWREAAEEYAKKRKDVRVEYGREGDQASILTSYAYAGGVSSKEIRDCLEDMLVASSWVGRMAYVGTRLAGMELQKELWKEAPTHLSQQELPLVLGVGYDDFLEESDAAAEGYWAFSVEDRSLRILNHGDRVEFVYACGFSDDVTLAARAAIQLLMAQWVAKNLPQEATAVEALWSPGNSEILWVKATYVLDGKMKGESLEKAYAEFRDKYSEKVDKQVDAVLAKVLE